VRRLRARYASSIERTVGPWQRVLVAAREEAERAGHRRVGTEHLLVALVAGGEGRAAIWLRGQGCDPAALRERVRAAIDGRSGDPQGVDPADLAPLGIHAGRGAFGGAPPPPRRWLRRDRELLAPETRAVIETATERAHGRGQRHLGADDVAAGLAGTRGTRAQQLLRDLGVDLEQLRVVAEGR
jgi:ATP-dependent Clp protease ATP-binding subunit ClpA